MMLRDYELWLYGSEARGDCDCVSDCDLLLVADGEVSVTDILPECRDLLATGNVSRYEWSEIEGMARYGSLFLHHLRLEGRCLDASSTRPFFLHTLLSHLMPYQRVRSDIRAFDAAVDDIKQSLRGGGSLMFELSVLATVVRHASILGSYVSGHPTFGRLRAVEVIVDLWQLSPWIKFSFAELYAYRLFADGRVARIPKHLSDEEVADWLTAANAVLRRLEEYADEYDKGLS